MVRLAVLLALLVTVVTNQASAQSSGGSFGGSRGFGGGSSSGSSGSSFGGGSSFGSSGSSYRDRQREREEQARRDREARARQEREARLQREREEARRAEEARIAAAAEAARVEAQNLAYALTLVPEERAQQGRYFSPTPPPQPLPSVNDRPSPTTFQTLPYLPTSQPPQRAVLQPNPLPARELHFNLAAGVTSGALAFIPFLFIGYHRRRRRRREAYARKGGYEVARLSIAFDPDARQALQARLEAIGRNHDMSTEDGMYDAARKVCEALGKHLDDAHFAIWSSSIGGPQEADSKFHGLTRDLKARFRHDVMRGDSTKEYAAKTHEGRGWVVVSIVSGASRRGVERSNDISREGVARYLHDLMAHNKPYSLVAFETIWSPAKELDRMSSAELAMLYPELVPFEGAPAQTVTCDSCFAVYAADLPECSVCGAPREFAK